MYEKKNLSDNELETNYSKFKLLLKSVKRDNIDLLIKYLDKSDLIYSPASTIYHHSYYGGLVEHSLEVYNNAVKLNKAMNFNIENDSLIITCLLHNLDKVNSFSEYRRNIKDDSGNWQEVIAFNKNDNFPIGGSEKSVISLQQFIKLKPLEIALIIGSTGTFNDKQYRYTKLIEVCPEAILLHTADVLSTVGKII